MVMSRRVVGVALLGLMLLVAVSGNAPTITQEEELTDEQKEYYEGVFATYDMDHDGFITMEENLEQDKAIAEEAGKPFDEVDHAAIHSPHFAYRNSHPSIPLEMLSTFTRG